jgi:ATP-binding cassette, subfamily C, bacterial PrsD
MTMLVIANEVSSTALAKATASALSARQNFTEDAKANRDSILAMGMLASLTARFEELAGKATAAQARSSDQAAFYSSAGKGFRIFLQSAVLGAGALLVIRGELSAGLMLAASVLTARALAPIEQVIGNWKGFVAARQALQRLDEAIAPAAPAPRTKLPRPSRGLVVQGMATGPDMTRPLVADIAFSVDAGQGLGIIGPSGSGKSSIARALTGVWPILRGEIRFDGGDIRHYDPEIIGRAIGYLPQEVELLDGTVAENIARFEGPRDSAPVIAAARAAGTDTMIARLPDGYDTRIGPRGSLLSAGQRQRIGLARALYGDPFLIVLDEPNANLDHEGEVALVEALQAAKARGAIVILVAHRPSAIAVTEQLAFVNNGRIGAYGPRDEVLKRITKPVAALPQATKAAG